MCGLGSVLFMMGVLLLWMDAEAICEAVTRASMRFVETKTPEQQSCLMLHRTRQLFIRQRPR